MNELRRKISSLTWTITSTCSLKLFHSSDPFPFPLCCYFISSRQSELRRRRLIYRLPSSCACVGTLAAPHGDQTRECIQESARQGPPPPPLGLCSGPGPANGTRGRAGTGGAVIVCSFARWSTGMQKTVGPFWNLWGLFQEMNARLELLAWSCC